MKVFLSSTYIDLIEYRDAAKAALERLGQQVGRMEIFGAKPVEPTAACLGEVEDCDLFLGIYAHRYGFVPEGSEISITEAELYHAKKLKKALFLFVLDDDFPWLPKMIEGEPGKSKLVTLKQNAGTSVVLETFTTTEDLAFKVAASVGRYLAKDTIVAEPKNPFADKLKSAGDLVELLERVLTELEQETGTDYNQVFLVTTSAYSKQLVAVADSIPAHKQRYRIAAFSGLLGSVVANGKTLNARNIRERPGYFQAVVETESELVVPIVRDNVVLGVINSESEHVDGYTKETSANVEFLAAALAELLPGVGWSPGVALRDTPWIQREPR